jgi:hypothetical protein
MITRSRIRGRRILVVLTLAGGALVLPAAGALAHETRRVGDHEVVVGWSNEPAYAGFGNEVQVVLSHGNEPIEDAELEAVVVYGDPDSQTTTDPIPLEPAFDTPGEYLGYIIPTRPGTYSFLVTGTVEGEPFDETFTSGPDTFGDIENPTAVEFPQQDPTRGDIAEALERLTSRVEDLRTKTSEDGGDSVALWIGIGAGVLALIALILALRLRPA